MSANYENSPNEFLQIKIIWNLFNKIIPINNVKLIRVRVENTCLCLANDFIKHFSDGRLDFKLNQFHEHKIYELSRK